VTTIKSKKRFSRLCFDLSWICIIYCITCFSCTAAARLGLTQRVARSMCGSRTFCCHCSLTNKQNVALSGGGLSTRECPRGCQDSCRHPTATKLNINRQDLGNNSLAPVICTSANTVARQSKRLSVITCRRALMLHNNAGGVITAKVIDTALRRDAG